MKNNNYNSKNKNNIQDYIGCKFIDLFLKNQS